MKPRLLADENTSHRLVAACWKLEAEFPIIHIADWEKGAFLSVKDSALLMTLRECGLVLVGFDRASMPQHAATLSREGLGHAGIILFRRVVSVVAYGRQARLLVDLWSQLKDEDWADRIEYVPRKDV